MAERPGLLSPLPSIEAFPVISKGGFSRSRAEANLPERLEVAIEEGNPRPSFGCTPLGLALRERQRLHSWQRLPPPTSRYAGASEA